MPPDDLLLEVKALRANIEALPGKIADAIEIKAGRFLWWAFKAWCFCSLVCVAIWSLEKGVLKSSKLFLQNSN
jgi:hypothetical protein